MPTGCYPRTKEHIEKLHRGHTLKWQDPESRARMAAINKQNMANPQSRQKCRNQGSFVKGHIVSEEIKARISERTKLAMARPEVRAKVSKAYEARKGKKNPELSAYMKQLWQNSEYKARNVKKMRLACHQKPNKPEQALISLFSQHSLPYKYCGNGEVVLGGLCPDFININGKKRLIELFGIYWHPVFDVAKRIEHFRQYGFSTLVIWQDELMDKAKVLKKIKRFTSKAGG